MLLAVEFACWLLPRLVALQSRIPVLCRIAHRAMATLTVLMPIDNSDLRWRNCLGRYWMDWLPIKGWNIFYRDGQYELQNPICGTPFTSKAVLNDKECCMCSAWITTLDIAGYR